MDKSTIFYQLEKTSQFSMDKSTISMVIFANCWHNLEGNRFTVAVIPPILMKGTPFVLHMATNSKKVWWSPSRWKIIHITMVIPGRFPRISVDFHGFRRHARQKLTRRKNKRETDTIMVNHIMNGIPGYLCTKHYFNLLHRFCFRSLTFI